MIANHRQVMEKFLPLVASYILEAQLRDEDEMGSMEAREMRLQQSRGPNQPAPPAPPLPTRHPRGARAPGSPPVGPPGNSRLEASQVPGAVPDSASALSASLSFSLRPSVPTYSVRSAQGADTADPKLVEHILAFPVARKVALAYVIQALAKGDLASASPFLAAAAEVRHCSGGGRASGRTVCARSRRLRSYSSLGD